MENSKPFTPLIKELRSKVDKAGLSNWGSLQRNVPSLIGNARSYVRTTSEMNEAFDNAQRRCEEFAEEIAIRGVHYSPNDSASKQARELALLAIDELEEQLEDARPSDEAVGLGLGW